VGQRWGTFSVYGVKLHMLCATNRVPISYELSAANTAEVRLTKELLDEARTKLGEEVARKLLADLAYRSEDLEEELAGSGIALVTGEASGRRPGARQRIEIALIRASSGPSGSARPWPLRSSWGWSPGSRRR
jgi:Transposase DDE domain